MQTLAGVADDRNEPLFDVEMNVLEILRRTETPQYEQPRYQVGFAVEDIRGVRQRLIEQGVETVTDVEGSPEVGGRWSYFRDPEGNVFEISERLGEPWS